MLANKKQDLRVTRTQRALVTAMTALLEKNGFQKTTVNDLCDLAMVSRTTFYQHFEDKYHLLRFSLEQIMEQERCRVEEGNIHQLITGMLDHVEEKAKMFRALLLEDMDYELLRMFSELWVRELTRKLEQRAAQGHSFPVPVTTLAVYMAGGMAQLLVGWVFSGFTPPKEELANQLLILLRISIGEGVQVL